MNIASAQQTWMPIETAPKVHGKHVLLFGDGVGFVQCLFFGVWDVDQDRFVTAFGIAMPCFPTHWMPMPEPPVPSAFASTDGGGK
jgi:Protein of unknown function (DUF551)